MHYFAERDVVDVAVHETRAWLRAQRLAIQTRHRLSLGFDGARAVSLAPDDSSMPSDQYYGPWQFFLLNGSLDDRVHASETLCRNAVGCRGTGWKLDRKCVLKKGKS